MIQEHWLPAGKETRPCISLAPVLDSCVAVSFMLVMHEVCVTIAGRASGSHMLSKGLTRTKNIGSSVASTVPSKGQSVHTSQTQFQIPCSLDN